MVENSVDVQSVDVHTEGFVHWGKNAEITERHHEEPTPKIDFWYQVKRSWHMYIPTSTNRLYKSSEMDTYQFRNYNKI